MAGIRRGLRRQRRSTRWRARALLAKDGWRVCVLERNDWLGGAIRTVEGLTAPGFTHEVFSSWHPLWVGSPAYAELKPDLDRLGLEYLNTDLPTGTAFPDGSSAFLSTDGAANARRTLGRRRGSASSTSSWPAPTSRSACSGRSSGRGRASRSAARPTAASAAAACVEFARRTRCSRPRLADGHVRRARRRTACSRPGCCTPGSARSRRCPAS